MKKKRANDKKGNGEKPKKPREEPLVSTALAIPDERVQTESDLRAKIAELNIKFGKLKTLRKQITRIIDKLEEECGEEMQEIRKYKRKELLGLFPELDEEVLKWIAIVGKEEKKGFELLSPDDKDTCKLLYRQIAQELHPDRYPDEYPEENAELMKAAAKAFEEGDIFTLRLIAKELEADGGGEYSRLLHSALDELKKEYIELELLVKELNSMINAMGVAGVKAGEHIVEDRLMEEAFSSAVMWAISEKMRECSIPERKLEEVKEQELSDETGLVKAEPEIMPAVIDEQEKEKTLIQRIQGVIARVRLISRYYAGLENYGNFIQIYTDESDVAKRVRIYNETRSDGAVGIHRKEIPKDTNLIAIDIGMVQKVCYFLIDSDGKITIPDSEKKQYAEAMSALDDAAEILSKPIRVLLVPDTRGLMMPILGHYEEHTDKRWLAKRYRMDDSTEIMLGRLMRAIVFLKTPRTKFWRYDTTYKVKVSGTDEVFDYDGSSGEKQPGDIVEMQITERNPRTQEREKRTVRGHIIYMEDVVEEDKRFDRFLGCSQMMYEGHLSINSEEIPFSMELRGNRGFYGSLRDMGEFSVRITINDKIISIHYGKGKETNERRVHINGIEERLFPSLVFRIVESLVVTKIHGVRDIIGADRELVEVVPIVDPFKS